MELSATSETISCAATQELPSTIWNPKVHYLIHKSPPLIPILKSPHHFIPALQDEPHTNIKITISDMIYIKIMKVM
jgi:hypothetical protein